MRLASPNPESEYDPYKDPDFGKRNFDPIDYKNSRLKVYFEKLRKGWPARMAAAAANQQRGK